MSAQLDTNFVTPDLVRAAHRSDDFDDQWDEARIRHAAARYERFFRLVAKHPGRAVAPTADIDAMWHLHMLSPRAYHRDCMRSMGAILDHDGGFGKAPGELEQLKRVFEATAALWETEYEEPYATESELKNCWHDCEGRCWHACSN